MAVDEKEASAGLKGVQTLMRGLDILDQVIDGPVKVTDLARNLALTKSTTHRLVQALRTRDYLSITTDGYSLGPKLLQLGTMAHEQVDYVRLARPHMEALSEQTGYCVFIGKREGDWSRHLERVTGRQRLRVATAPGDRRQIVETGLGKALLLDEDPETLTRLFRADRPDADAKRLKAWLSEIETHAKRGVVVHESEAGDGVRSVAAPIRDSKGKIAIALSIAGASVYLTDEVIANLIAPVRNAAADVSAVLGHATR
ncbi:IclR family transcriptional regulator [Sphingomonas sp. BT-65]|uniref:IclR family transcriptional regulator n=1 Tax=Sphingomonas sp. BT-65 TaxID=2989821 RepID=UPI002235D809|nr:IclR family transcriptional regulator [Sphingomonas sp. BT-65]MCW4463897.1 IclR family transcriptional regulator [Sphingomonas sp. BT-65]